jgi:hypothetical protein
MDITPTKQELTRRIGDGILTYTRTEDGRFVPVWSETNIVLGRGSGKRRAQKYL